MEKRAARRLPFYIGLIFGIFLVSLAAKELLTVLSATVIAEQDAKLERDWEFNARLKNVTILLKDAELGMHAYLLSGNRSFLPEPENLEGRYEAEFKLLNNLLSGNPIQQKNFGEFQAVTSRHLRQLEEEIAAGLRGEITAPAVWPQPEFLNDNWENIRILRNLETAIEAKQTILIKLREKELHDRYQYTLAFCVAACIMFMTLLILFYRMNRKYSVQLNISQSELRSKNHELKNDIELRAEQLTGLSHHLLAVSEQEKAGLARELHDELGSNLTAIRLDLLAVLKKIKPIDNCLAIQIREALELLHKTLDIKRRIIESLHPSTLENLGLAAAIRIHGEEVAQRSGLRIDMKMDEEFTDTGSAQAIALYRIVQESLTNTVKYARAKRVSISLLRDLDGLNLRIVDDGAGFNKATLKQSKSHGILGMRERATLLGGSFDIDSNAGGYGTCIDVFLPEREK